MMPHRSRGKDKRETIMKAAEKLFTSRRFHEITMDHVAAAAGVPARAGYARVAASRQYFETSDGQALRFPPTQFTRAFT